MCNKVPLKKFSILPNLLSNFYVIKVSAQKWKFPKQRKESTHCFIENKLTKPW